MIAEDIAAVLKLGESHFVPCCPTLCGADAHPCAFNHRALPAKASVIQAGIARGGGWARLTLTVGRHTPGKIPISTVNSI